MACHLEYHELVRRSIPVSVALFGLFAVPLFLVASSQAQTPGAQPSMPPSAGGHMVTGIVPTGPVHPTTGPVNPPTGTVPPSTSIGFSGIPAVRADSRHDGDGHRHHHRDPYGAIWYAVPIGAVDDGANNANNANDDDATDNADADDSDGYQGGPTVFDRRGSGADSYVPPVSIVPAPHSALGADRPATPSDPPNPTILVFKDGHKLEVGNYAIIGQTLFDMTPGHSRRVPLADLDLEATQQQNDDRGVTFQLPMSSQAN
jgi:hypothetical protein